MNYGLDKSIKPMYNIGIVRKQKHERSGKIEYIICSGSSPLCGKRNRPNVHILTAMSLIMHTDNRSKKYFSVFRRNLQWLIINYISRHFSST